MRINGLLDYGTQVPSETLNQTVQPKDTLDIALDFLNNASTSLHSPTTDDLTQAALLNKSLQDGTFNNSLSQNTTNTPNDTTTAQTVVTTETTGVEPTDDTESVETITPTESNPVIKLPDMQPVPEVSDDILNEVPDSTVVEDTSVSKVKDVQKTDALGLAGLDPTKEYTSEYVSHILNAKKFKDMTGITIETLENIPYKEYMQSLDDLYQSKVDYYNTLRDVTSRAKDLRDKKYSLGGSNWIALAAAFLIPNKRGRGAFINAYYTNNIKKFNTAKEAELATLQDELKLAEANKDTVSTKVGILKTKIDYNQILSDRLLTAIGRVAADNDPKVKALSVPIMLNLLQDYVKDNTVVTGNFYDIVNNRIENDSNIPVNLKPAVLKQVVDVAVPQLLSLGVNSINAELKAATKTGEFQAAYVIQPIPDNEAKAFVELLQGLPIQQGKFNLSNDDRDAFFTTFTSDSMMEMQNSFLLGYSKLTAEDRALVQEMLQNNSDLDAIYNNPESLKNKYSDRSKNLDTLISVFKQGSDISRTMTSKAKTLTVTNELRNATAGYDKLHRTATSNIIALINTIHAMPSLDSALQQVNPALYKNLFSTDSGVSTFADAVVSKYINDNSFARSTTAQNYILNTLYGKNADTIIGVLAAKSNEDFGKEFNTLSKNVNQSVFNVVYSWPSYSVTCEKLGSGLEAAFRDVMPVAFGNSGVTSASTGKWQIASGEMDSLYTTLSKRLTNNIVDSYKESVSKFSSIYESNNIPIVDTKAKQNMQDATTPVNFKPTANVSKGLAEQIVSDYGSFVSKWSSKYDIPEVVLYALIGIESSGNPNPKNTKSSAVGLTQIIPKFNYDKAVGSIDKDIDTYFNQPDGTYSNLASTNKTKAQKQLGEFLVNNPDGAIHLSAYILSRHVASFGNDPNAMLKALAAYKAGFSTINNATKGKEPANFLASLKGVKYDPLGYLRGIAGNADVFKTVLDSSPVVTDTAVTIDEYKSNLIDTATSVKASSDGLSYDEFKAQMLAAMQKNPVLSKYTIAGKDGKKDTTKFELILKELYQKL